MITDTACFLRRFHLATEDGGMAWDRTCELVFTKDGRMFVRVVKDFSQDYKSPDIHEILPENFSKEIIDGKCLSDLVVAKLQDILPQRK